MPARKLLRLAEGSELRVIKMSKQGAEGKVRRTHGSASKKRKKGTTCVNGEWFPTLMAAINFLSTLGTAINGLSSSLAHCAASDDEGGSSAAKTATSRAVRADHFACAEVAGEPSVKEAKPCVPSESEDERETSGELPAGESELPEDSRAFVAQVNARVDLRAAWERLVRAKDLKIAARALEKLSELDYERSGGEETRRVFSSEAPPRGSV
jgi:hypothetical protein